MRANLKFVVWVLALIVAALTLYWKGDLSAKFDGRGIKMEIEVKEKKPMPGIATPAP